MNQGKFIFAQLTDFLPQRVFDRLVIKYNGNKHVRHFTCWNQLLSMIFGQLTGRDSLRDLMISIEPHKPKYYHLGFGKGTSRSNFANANEKRDCKIYEEYAFYLIDLARKSSIVDQDFQLNFDGNIYAFDSTTIDLCLSVFCGPSSVRQRVESNFIHFMMLKPQFLRLSMHLPLQYMM